MRALVRWSPVILALASCLTSKKNEPPKGASAAQSVATTEGNPSSEDARHWQRACEGGEVGVCHNLGILEHRKGNFAEAEKFHRRACNGGHMLGCDSLGFLEKKKGNVAEAGRLYRQACDGGEMAGCFHLELWEEERGNLQACYGGNMMGCHDLGLLEHQKGNVAKARSLWNRACDGGLKKACQNLVKLNR